MSCLTTARKTQLQTRLTAKEAQLTAAYTAFDELTAQSIESYSFDSGEGKQSTKRRQLGSMQKAIDILEAQIDWIQGKLNNTGIMNLNLRRLPS